MCPYLSFPLLITTQNNNNNNLAGVNDWLLCSSTHLFDCTLIVLTWTWWRFWCVELTNSWETHELNWTELVATKWTVLISWLTVIVKCVPESGRWTSINQKALYLFNLQFEEKKINEINWQRDNWRCQDVVLQLQQVLIVTVHCFLSIECDDKSLTGDDKRIQVIERHEGLLVRCTALETARNESSSG